MGDACGPSSNAEQREKKKSEEFPQGIQMPMVMVREQGTLRNPRWGEVVLRVS